jgi:[ribosomal protein S18]-alanine N-acetyltransferase
MTQAVTIERVSDVAGIDALLEIDRDSFSSPWTREQYERELQNEQSVVVAARGPDGCVAGYCSFWVIVDEIHINNLAVRPAFRSRGIGRALVEHVLRLGLTLNARAATLEVRRSNAAARRLYERLGFSQRGVRARYYTAPDDDALILWAEIQQYGSNSGA